jgi:hypothetical protein
MAAHLQTGLNDDNRNFRNFPMRMRPDPAQRQLWEANAGFAKQGNAPGRTNHD